MTYRAILVDDDSLFRDWLRSLLQTSEDFKVIGEASCAADCIVLLNAVNADVVVVDVHMPGRDGLELAEHIKTHFTVVKTIVTSSHNDRVYSRLAEQEGAQAFIPKAELSIASLLDALRAAPVP